MNRKGYPVVRLVLHLVLTVALVLSAHTAVLAGPPPGKGKSSVYIVRMIHDPVVAYEGDIPGLPATKPGRGQKINPNSGRVRRYVEFLDARHSDALAAVGANERIYDYHFTFNGFAAKLTPDQVAALRARPDVLQIWADELRPLMTDNTPDFLGLTAAGGLWEQEYLGEDVIVGVIDTGIWPEHPSFSDQIDLADRPGNSGKGTLAYESPPASWSGACQSGELFSQDDCNNKLIGARYFKDGFSNFEINTSGDYLSARDADGHGSHTASTAAGNANVPASILGIDRGLISGMAPRARVAAYKGCWAEAGCALSDLAAAIDMAVADGVDVINYSIGSDATSLGPDAIAFLFAADAGVFVATSAGNSGPDASTIGSPAWVPWVTSVGASSHSRYFLSDITVSGPDTPPTNIWGGSVTHGVTGFNLVDAEGILDITEDDSGECLNPFPPNTFQPTDVVLCNHYDFGVARVTRVANVAAGGGGAVILHNVPTVNVMPTDNHPLPTVHVLHDVGQPLKDYLVAHPGEVTVSFTAGAASYTDTDPRIKAPVMTSFSSRGPNGGALDIIKPDVTAPGYSILAAANPTALSDAAPGQLFQAIMGTSMSSPHVAGLGALLVQAHPDWSPAMIKSALMTTAYQEVWEGDGTIPADPFDMGAGHVNPNPAQDPGLTYHAELNDYFGFLCGNNPANINPALCAALGGAGISLEPSNLNQASIGVAALAGTETVQRTVTNVGPAATYAVSVEAPAGVDVSVSPSSLTLAEGESATYAVTFTTLDGASIGQWTFGALTWTDGEHSVRSPIAVKPVAIAAPDEVMGTGTEGSLDFDVTFGYTGPYTATVHGLHPAETQADTVVDDPANDINTALLTGVGINEHTVSIDPGTVHVRFSLFDAYTDGNDDLDLYVFDADGNFVDGSGSPTSEEQVDLPLPASGVYSDTYTVIVHGWQTDGPDANYTLFAWSVGGDAGNMAVTAPAAATLSDTETITVDWFGLTTGAKYLGAVSHNDAGGLADLTIVRIDTDTSAGATSANATVSSLQDGSPAEPHPVFLPAIMR